MFAITRFHYDLIQWNLNITNFYITKVLDITIDFLHPGNSKYMKKNLDMTKPRYSEHINFFASPLALRYIEVLSVRGSFQYICCYWSKEWDRGLRKIEVPSYPVFNNPNVISNKNEKNWKVSKSYYAMFIIKALLMTRLKCIFAYRILPLLMRSWVGDRSNPKDPVVLRGGGGRGGCYCRNFRVELWSWGTATISLQQTTFNYFKKIPLLQTNCEPETP